MTDPMQHLFMQQKLHSVYLHLKYLKVCIPSARYSNICNVLRLWCVWVIPTYRVYQLYDYIAMYHVDIDRESYPIISYYILYSFRMTGKIL